MMAYTHEQQDDFMQAYISAHTDLHGLMLECLRQAETIDVAGSRNHLCHGAARRLGVMGRAMQNVFALFPLSTDEPLPMESLHDVQINLHAFVINLYGVFENFAWAFVVRHELLPIIGSSLKVGMFKASTQKHLSLAVTEYLSAEEMALWHSRYLKKYRDALAHRIPLYIPPKVLTKDEGDRYNALEIEKRLLAGRADWDGVNSILAEQKSIGAPCFNFLHSIEEGEASRDVSLHPQIISDSKTIIDFGLLFLAEWHDHR